MLPRLCIREALSGLIAHSLPLVCRHTMHSIKEWAGRVWLDSTSETHW